MRAGEAKAKLPRLLRLGDRDQKAVIGSHVPLFVPTGDEAADAAAVKIDPDIDESLASSDAAEDSIFARKATKTTAGLLVDGLSGGPASNATSVAKVGRRTRTPKVETARARAAREIDVNEGVAKAREKGREIKAQMKVEAFLRNEFGGARGIERFDAASYEDSLN